MAAKKRRLLLRQDGKAQHYYITDKKLHEERDYNPKHRWWQLKEQPPEPPEPPLPSENVKLTVAITSYKNMDLDIVLERILPMDDYLQQDRNYWLNKIITEGITLLLKNKQKGLAAMINDEKAVAGIEIEYTDEDTKPTEFTRFVINKRNILKQAMALRPDAYNKK